LYSTVELGVAGLDEVAAQVLAAEVARPDVAVAERVPAAAVVEVDVAGVHVLDTLPVTRGELLPQPKSTAWSLLLMPLTWIRFASFTPSWSPPSIARSCVLTSR
jgi:hypothetical protein